MTQINFNNTKELSEQDINEITELLSRRCNKETKRRIEINLRMSKSFIPHYGILDRLIKDNYGWSYCAGQSYPDEIRTVRNIIKTLS